MKPSLPSVFASLDWKRFPLARSVAAIAVALGSVPVANAQLKVDIGQSVGGTVTPEAGFESFLSNSSAPLTNTYTAPFGTGAGGTVSVELTSPFYRSTPTSSYPQVTSMPGLNDLLSGSALMNSPAQGISLVLDDFEDGTYSLTTYHHANFTPSTGAGQLDISVLDATKPYDLIHDNVAVSAGTTPGAITTRMTEFTVADGQPVLIGFGGQAGISGPEHANLNGFEISKLSDDAPATAPLLVDFSRSTGGGGETQTGFVEFEHDGNTPKTQSIASVFGSAGNVDVTVSGQGFWRNYAAAAGTFAPLTDLLHDGALVNDQGTITLTLEDLADGVYELSAFMHTTQFGPSERGPATPFDVFLSDGVVANDLVAADVTMSDNGSDMLSVVTLQFEVVGGSAVALDFVRGPGLGGGLNGMDHMAIAGFQLNAVPSQVIPEPSSVLSLGLLALFLHTGRRARNSASAEK